MWDLICWAAAVSYTTISSRSDGGQLICRMTLFHSYREILNGGNPEILFHREIIERTRNAFDAAGVCGEDVIAYDLDMTDAERNTVLATAAHYSPVSVRRAKAPNRKIWRKSHIALNGL